METRHVVGRTAASTSSTSTCPVALDTGTKVASVNGDAEVGKEKRKKMFISSYCIFGSEGVTETAALLLGNREMFLHSVKYGYQQGSGKEAESGLRKSTFQDESTCLTTVLLEQGECE